MKCVEFFQAINFLELIRAEMIIQVIWAWRPGRLRSVNITNLSSAGGNCWMLRAHQTYYASLSMQIVNTFICSDSSKPFSLIIHGWKVVLLDASDRLLAETDDAFEIITVECYTSCATESKEPLHSLLLAFALSGWPTAGNVSLGWLQNTALFLDGQLYVYAVTLSSVKTYTRK